MKRLKLFEAFDQQSTDHPSPNALNTTTEKFDPAKEELYSFKDEHNSIVVDAEFSKDSYLHKFKPSESKQVLRLMPSTVQDVGYLGEGDGIGWKITFKPGVSFEKGWQSLVENEDSIMSFFQKLIGNISTRFWGFIGLNSMPKLDAEDQPEDGYEITTMVP